MFSADGAVRWARQNGSRADETAWSVDFDPSGDVLVCGLTAAGFGGHSGLGGDDGFVQKLGGGDGAVLWSHQLGASGMDGATALAVGGDGIVVVVGHSARPLMPSSYQNQGGYDIYITMMSASGGLWSDSRAPTTAAPITPVPSLSPATSAPSASPVTSIPSTSVPSMEPSTSAPTTPVPTTSSPTSSPATSAPSLSPSTSVPTATVIVRADNEASGNDVDDDDDGSFVGAIIGGAVAAAIGMGLIGFFVFVSGRTTATVTKGDVAAVGPVVDNFGFSHAA